MLGMAVSLRNVKFPTIKCCLVRRASQRLNLIDDFSDNIVQIFRAESPKIGQPAGVKPPLTMENYRDLCAGFSPG